MSHDTIVPFKKEDDVTDPLTELLRQGARQLLNTAIEAEVEELLSAHRHRHDAHGRTAVVRNGHLPERQVLTGIGPIVVKVPKVRDRLGEGVVFHSSFAPPYVRKSQSIEAALPWLYLRGVSTGNMAEALSVLVGKNAAGLSPAVVSRLKAQWTGEYQAFRQQSLAHERFVYLWADGIYASLRADDQRLCLLVVIGVNDRGQKKFLAIEDGVRESTESWRDVLAAAERSRPEDRPYACRRRRRLGVLGRVVGTLSRDDAATLLGTQDDERPELSAEGCAAQGQIPAARDLDGGDEARRFNGVRSLPRSLSSQVSQGHGLFGQRPRRAIGFLRFSGGTLGAYPDHESHRIDLCHHPTSHRPNPGQRLARDAAGPGLQTRDERREKFLQNSRLSPPGRGDRWREIQRWSKAR